MTRECPRCGSDEFHDITTFGQRLELLCAWCGARYVHQFVAQPMGKVHGPDVPTSEQILTEAWRLLT